MAYKPQHLKRGVAKGTPGYEGRHRLEDKAPTCPNPWHESAPARKAMPCPECPMKAVTA